MSCPDSSTFSTSRLGSKVEQAVGWIERAIASGRWNDQLPGLREMAELTGASCGTLGKALKLLQERGRIVSPGPKRRFRVVPRRQDRAAMPARRSLLLLVPKSPGRRASGEHWQIVARLVDLLQSRGWTVRFRMVAPGGGIDRRRWWNRLCQTEPPDAVVALLGDAHLARWAKSRGIRLLCVGGAPASGVDPTPTIGISVSMMLRRTLGELQRLGHRRMVFPMQGRQAVFTAALRKVFGECLAQSGERFRASLHMPEITEPGPAAFGRTIREVMHACQPTAWICLDWHEFLWLKRELEVRGLRIPRDVSVVVLCSHEHAAWIEPEPTRFEHPIERLAAEVVRWLDGAAGDGPLTLVPATWVRGASIAPAAEMARVLAPPGKASRGRVLASA